MDKWVSEFIDIVKKNPELPVIPLVDSEVVSEGDAYGRWMGSIGFATVGDFCSYGGRFYTDREEFKEDYFCRNDDELCEKFNYDPGLQILQNRKIRNASKEETDANDAAEKALEEYLETIANRAFKTGILVYIDTPDDLDEFAGTES